MKKIISVAVASIIALQFCSAHAAVSAEEAQQLKGPLTPFGAIKAGNAEGTIPEYKGGLTSAPAGFDPKSGLWPDPFKDEQPVLKITPQNMAQYSDKLTGGAQALLKRYPSYRMDVYPTHRSMHYPEWVLENTLKNATNAKLVGTSTGDGVEGAVGGVPFPIPQNGYEVMWNNNLSFQRIQTEASNIGQYLMDSAGRRTQLPVIRQNQYSAYYGDGQKGAASTLYNQTSADISAPPTMAGTAFLITYPLNYSTADQQTWLYSPGQRRVRLSPDFKYDTPNAQNGGVVFWDELQLFRGRMDRFDMKLVGRKEMYVPYNNYRRVSLPVDDVYGKEHLNPDALRWELHRVWVVEATLKPGARHAYSKRVFYFDEDNWGLVGADGYDQDGKIWRVGMTFQFNFYDGGGGVFSSGTSFNDLQKGNYFAYLSPTANGAPKVFAYDKQVNPSSFTASGLSGQGLR
jgi:hypothetical protein